MKVPIYQLYLCLDVVQTAQFSFDNHIRFDAGIIYDGNIQHECCVVDGNLSLMTFHCKDSEL